MSNFTLWPLKCHIVFNVEMFQTNSEIHTLNVRYRRDIHKPVGDLVYQKGIYCAQTKLYLKLPL